MKGYVITIMFKRKINQQEEIKMAKENQEKIDTTEFKLAQDGQVVKLENENDVFVGQFVSIDQSRKFPDSYALKVKDQEGNFIVTFVSVIVLDKVRSNAIQVGQLIKLVYKGLTKSGNGYEYKNYDLYFK